MVRNDTVKKGLDTDKLGDLPGSKSLFHFNYDCNLEALATALIKSDCTRSSFDYKALGKGSNFYSGRSGSDFGAAVSYEFAVDEWAGNPAAP
ncbi:unnamed protein product, partial [Strongylus vulgaris]